MVVDWELGENVWRAAGRAFAHYLTRAGKARVAGPRRILADFLIGAYAFENSYNLLTLDDRLYRSAFPRLKLLPV
jgi:predicted nucleic acid-binding protein